MNMRYYIDPGRERKSITFMDQIVFSTVDTPVCGGSTELKLSIMVTNGNSEMRAATGKDQTASKAPSKPCIVWIPGGGWRTGETMRNLMVPEMMFLADAGFVVVSIRYRNSGEAHFPAQLIDCKSAVRFLRANAEKYRIDPDRIGVMGRSAGGHLAAWMAMNTDGFDEGDNLEYSSKVSAAWDMFGPVDLQALVDLNVEAIKDPGYRWHNLNDTHEGALLGANDENRAELAYKASPVNFINDGMCPILITHGDADPLVPYTVSEAFYDRLCAAGLEDRSTLYLLRNAGHGSDEFFQPSTKDIVVRFFKKNLMNI